MSRSLAKLLNGFVAHLISFLLIVQPTIAYAADGLNVDAAAAAANRAMLDSAQNGVPVVNIVDPNSSGLSHNKFTDFNVGQQGVILNNSLQVGISKLGGALNANPNLSSEARIILNEVTGTGRSSLQGATEIFGGRAEYVLVNPNGVTCNGCGFINTPRVTLSTGIPVLQNADLAGFNVDGGDIIFEGAGFNGNDGELALDSFDIISRTSKIAAALHVKGGLNVITGRNDVRYSDLNTVKKADAGAKPALAVDSSAIGGMYAGKIKLLATEEGVGVKAAGDMVTNAGDMVITADGNIEYAGAVSAADLKISSANGNVKQDKGSYAVGDLKLQAGGNIDLAGDMAAAGKDISLDAGGNITLDDLHVQSGLQIDEDDVSFTSGTGDITLNANGTVTNAGGNLVSGNALNIGSDSQLVNSGLIQSYGDMEISSAGLDNRSTYISDYTKGIIAGGDMNINSGAGDIDNTSGAIIAGGDITLEATSGNIDNTGDAIIYGSKLKIITDGNVINNALVQSLSDMEIEAGSVNNSGSYDPAGSIIEKGFISGGHLSLNADTINNSSGAIDARGNINLGTSGALDNNTGYISTAATSGTSSITVDSLDNAGGKILAAGDMDISVNSGSNNGGLISSLKSLFVGSFGTEFTNDSGDLYSEDSLSLKNVNNSHGKIQAGNNINIDNSDLGDFDNTAGKVLAFNDGSIVSINVATNGNMAMSNQNIDLVESAYVINGDIITGGHFDLTADSLVNNAVINAGDYISIVLTSGNFTNSASGKLLSADSISIDLTGAGNIINYGEISAPDIDINISGGNLNNHSGAIISSSDAAQMLIINVAGSINNSGRISSVGDAGISAVTLNNNAGQIASDADLTITTSGNTVHNTDGGLIYATSDLALYSDTIENENSNIFSLDGNITMQKNIAGDKSSAINNISGEIEAFSGDITIRAVNLTNTRDSFATVLMPARNGGGNIILDSDPQAEAPPAGTFLSNAASDGRWAFWGGGWHNEHRYIFRMSGSNGEAGKILAAGDIGISGDNILNEAGLIAAGNDINISGTGLVNRSSVAQEWMLYAAASKNGGSFVVNTLDTPSAEQTYMNAVHSYIQTWGDISYQAPLRTEIASASIVAGNNIAGTVDNLANSEKRIGGAAPTINVRSGDTYATLSGLDSTADAVNNAPSAIDAVQSGVLSYTSSPVLDTARFADVPAHGSGLFIKNTAPGANYLVETNSSFIDMSRFLGSQYFLTRIGYTIPSDTKILGDAFYETTLVRSAIFERTGKRYLTDGIGTDLAQMKTLFDNAVNEQTSLSLSVGVELTAEQIAALSSDIIWMVETEIDGQKVLKPVIYLAKATLEALDGHGSRITAGNNINITATDSLQNAGLLSANNNLSIQAANDILNTGKITAGQNLNLTSITGSVINTAIAKTTSNAGHLTGFLQSMGVISSGGDTTITAAENIINHASEITAGNNLTLTAITGDVIIDAAQLRNRLETSGKKYKRIDDSLTNATSTITAGDNITITSGTDTILQAAKLNSGNDINIDAGGTVGLLTATDSEYHQLQKTKKNLITMTSSDSGSYKEQVNHVEIVAGGQLNITGADGVVVQYRESGNLNDSVAQLARAPELAWMAQLQNDPNVDWHAVEEAYRTWNHKSTTLTPAASVVIAIAVTLATQGAGAGLIGATAGTAGAAASSAAFSALAAQATISLANNQGNIGRVFKELASSQTIRNLAVAALTAGATQGIVNDYGITDGAAKSAINAGVSSTAQSIVTGADFDEALINSLKFAAADAIGANLAEKIGDAQLGTIQSAIAHAVVGCATGAINGSCAGGAIGAATAETIAKLTFSSGINDLAYKYASGEMTQAEYLKQAQELARNGAQYGQFAALGATLLASNGEANVVTAGNQAAVTAVENNTLLHAALGAMAVAATAMTIYDSYSAYVNAGGGEDGAIAALKVIATDAAVTFLAGGVIKIGTKVYPSAKLAFEAYVGSSQMAQDIGKTILTKSGQIADTATASIAKGLDKISSVSGVTGLVTSKIVKTAEEVNASFIDNLVSKGVSRENVLAPWTGEVTEFVTTNEQKLYRVFSGNVDTNMAREWVFTQKTLDEANALVVQGKYANKYDALQDILSIPNKPTSMAVGNIPAGTSLRTGTANGGTINGITFNGKADQIEIISNVEKSWFKEIN